MDEPTAVVAGMTDMDGYSFHFLVTEQQAHDLLEAAPDKMIHLNRAREAAFFSPENIFVYACGEGEDGLKSARVDGELVRGAISDMIYRHRIDPVWIS